MVRSYHVLRPTSEASSVDLSDADFSLIKLADVTDSAGIDAVAVSDQANHIVPDHSGCQIMQGVDGG